MLPAGVQTIVDYLFIAFNTSTALSPTDTSVLSRWAKGLMMIQSLISLSTIVLFAARAVNIFEYRCYCEAALIVAE